MLNYLLNFVLGLGIGFIAGLLGVGGGFLIVPTLVILGEPIHLAIGTSLACITISALASAYTHLRRGAVLFRVVLIKETFSMPFAVIGAYLSSLIPTRPLKVIFAGLLLYLTYSLFRSRGECHNETAGEINYRRVPLVGILAGLTSGLLGISGGVLNVPLFHTYIGLPMGYSVGTSSLSLFFTALAGTIGHYRLGQVDLHAALLLAPGLIIGAHYGALAVHRLRPVFIKRIFAVLLIIVALKMLL
ncbi:sulfite exporter TauE/SafE family protein [Thermococcus sp. Bubb.Bath]|uniref:sulfite exporter TauE/SafE family protein n=1 Tax=Thermococcus sp. Bubb.Bath TaxID=1638242 RepID=UPI00143A5C42|nr:sulfite exporter TauE/SafE family protein [Thermococcus sp. Bubb.Bath]NJF25644.1 sulfite exporter TauE/SafE family protein [Thermococcus sp. Bubb.Bath]